MTMKTTASLVALLVHCLFPCSTASPQITHAYCICLRHCSTAKYLDRPLLFTILVLIHSLGLFIHSLSPASSITIVSLHRSGGYFHRSRALPPLRLVPRASALTDRLCAMDACERIQISGSPPHENGGFESQNLAQRSLTSPHVDSTVSLVSNQDESRCSTSKPSPSDWNGSEDVARSTAPGVPHESTISKQTPNTKMEPFRRVIGVVRTDRHGSEDLKLANGLFDSGSDDVNLIDEKLAKGLGVEFHSASLGSQFFGKKICNADGSLIRLQHKVKIRWYCLDKTRYDKQVLWFSPRYYQTQHYVVKNLAVDLLFSIRTWEDLKLRQPRPPLFMITRIVEGAKENPSPVPSPSPSPSPVCMITRPPKPDLSPRNLAKMAADKVKQAKRRNEERAKRANAYFDAKKAAEKGDQLPASIQDGSEKK
ncbi:hypothetical protein HDK77DRAFT_129181 [Phyllosticta capitalensis]